MRAAIVAFAVLVLLSVAAVSASIVIHDGQPGIVAMRDSAFLDSSGHVWRADNGVVWTRDSDLDPPISVDQIKFWDEWSLMTVDNVLWHRSGSVWVNCGPWPGLSAVSEPTAATLSTSPKSIPNPSAGSCRVTFQTTAVGPVSVQVFDASGRLVRQLHDGALPIGDFSLGWDGRDDTGQDLPSGVYVAKIQSTAGASTAKMTLTR